jgi:hypothetical protein
MGRGVIFRRPAAGGQKLLGQPADDVVVLGVDHDHGAFGPGEGQHVEHLTVVELQGVVGQVDLEGGIAVADEGRQLLTQDLLRRVRHDQVEGVIHIGLAFGPRVVVRDHLPQRLAPVLGGEGDDAGGSAAHGRAGTGLEVVRRVEARRAELGDVAVAVDAAGQHQLAAGVDYLLGARQILRQGDDPPVRDADVGPDSIGRRRDRSALDDQVVGRHRLRLPSREPSAPYQNRRPRDGCPRFPG